MKTDYEKLSEVVEVSGTGIPSLTAKCVKRTAKKAMYYRNDNVYEVFKIKISKEEEAFGKTYPKREVYPGNEDFGKTAWTYREEKNALRRYNEI